MSNISKETAKNTGFSMPGYIKALLVMAATGIVCSAVLFFMKQLSAVDLVMYTLSFAGIFCEFLLFSRGKRLPAVLISLIPLAVEIITEFFFTSGGADPLSEGNYIGMPEFSLWEGINAVDVIVYVGIPLLTTLFFAIWKKGDKDTLPLNELYDELESSFHDQLEEYGDDEFVVDAGWVDQFMDFCNFDEE